MEDQGVNQRLWQQQNSDFAQIHLKLFNDSFKTQNSSCNSAQFMNSNLYSSNTEVYNSHAYLGVGTNKEVQNLKVTDDKAYIKFVDHEYSIFKPCIEHTLKQDAIIQEPISDIDDIISLDENYIQDLNWLSETESRDENFPKQDSSSYSQKTQDSQNRFTDTQKSVESWQRSDDKILDNTNNFQSDNSSNNTVNMTESYSHVFSEGDYEETQLNQPRLDAKLSFQSTVQYCPEIQTENSFFKQNQQAQSAKALYTQNLSTNSEKTFQQDFQDHMCHTQDSIKPLQYQYSINPRQFQNNNFLTFNYGKQVAGNNHTNSQQSCHSHLCGNIKTFQGNGSQYIQNTNSSRQYQRPKFTFNNSITTDERIQYQAELSKQSYQSIQNSQYQQGQFYKQGRFYPTQHSYQGYCPNEQQQVYVRNIRQRSNYIQRHPYCTRCGTITSPAWRKGPAGPKTLCNACGVKYMKEFTKKECNTKKRESLFVNQSF